MKTVHSQDGTTLAYDIYGDGPPVDRAAQVTVPLQIVVGEKSPKSVKSSASQLANAMPDVALVELPGQDHMVGAKALLPVLTKFLKTAA